MTIKATKYNIPINIELDGQNVAVHLEEELLQQTLPNEAIALGLAIKQYLRSGYNISIGEAALGYLRQMGYTITYHDEIKEDNTQYPPDAIF